MFLIARVFYVGVYLSGIAVVRTLVWVVSWVGLVLMLIAAARPDLRNRKAPGALQTGGFSTTRTQARQSGGRSGAFGFFICSRSSLRSSFICFVSSGRISLMKHRSRPTITFSNLSTVLPVDVTAMALRELQIRAVAGDREQIGLVDARPDDELVFRDGRPAVEVAHVERFDRLTGVLGVVELRTVEFREGAGATGAVARRGDR